jgi:hypothetical protein
MPSSPGSLSAPPHIRAAHRRDGVSRQLSCGSSIIYAYAYTYNHIIQHMCTSRCICIFTQHRSAEPVCQAALLLPGLVLTQLISESVRPAAAGSVSTQPMRERVLPSGSTAVISLTTAHPRDGVARQICCGSLFIYAYTFLYNRII